MTPLSIDRATLASMRIESGLMPALERRALHLAEAHQRRIEAVLALIHDVEGAQLEAVPVVELRLALGVDR